MATPTGRLGVSHSAAVEDDTLAAASCCPDAEENTHHTCCACTTKPVPWMCNAVPPTEGPDLGNTDATVGVSTYWKRAALVDSTPPAWLRTCTSTTGAGAAPVCSAAGGVTQVTVASDKNVAGTSTSTADTPDPCTNTQHKPSVLSTKPLPATVITSPPLAGPYHGTIACTAGAGTYMNGTTSET